MDGRRSDNNVIDLVRLRGKDRLEAANAYEVMGFMHQLYCGLAERGIDPRGYDANRIMDEAVVSFGRLSMRESQGIIENEVTVEERTQPNPVS